MALRYVASIARGSRVARSVSIYSSTTRHIATSVYLLNQQPLTRRFQTIEQYRDLRTRFLTTYTECIAQNQSLQTPGAK
jgi:hypothetical protein